MLLRRVPVGSFYSLCDVTINGVCDWWTGTGSHLICWKASDTSAAQSRPYAAEGDLHLERLVSEGENNGLSG